jgi:hypothetical protein
MPQRQNGHIPTRKVRLNCLEDPSRKLGAGPLPSKAGRPNDEYKWAKAPQVVTERYMGVASDDRAAGGCGAGLRLFDSALMSKRESTEGGRFAVEEMRDLS